MAQGTKIKGRFRNTKKSKRCREKHYQLILTLTSFLMRNPAAIYGGVCMRVMIRPSREGYVLPKRVWMTFVCWSRWPQLGWLFTGGFSHQHKRQVVCVLVLFWFHGTPLQILVSQWSSRLNLCLLIGSQLCIQDYRKNLKYLCKHLGKLSLFFIAFQKRTWDKMEKKSRDRKDMFFQKSLILFFIMVIRCGVVILWDHYDLVSKP